MRKIKKIFAASTMAVMLMLPTYGAMASSVSLTQKSELDSKEVRALAISNDVDPAMHGLNPYPLKSTTTSSGAIKYQKQVTKNRTYSLYVSGNENVSKPHKIVISGRYTS